jgi:hypothetical protein
MWIATLRHVAIGVADPCNGMNFMRSRLKWYSGRLLLYKAVLTCLHLYDKGRDTPLA